MAIKKYTNGAWVPTNYRKFGIETDVITALPAQIIGDGQAITSCQISGNTIQDGTPTPEAPVDVVGCGESKNLLDNTAGSTSHQNVTIMVNADKTITLNGTLIYSSRHITLGYVNFVEREKYTISGVTGFTDSTLQIFVESNSAFPAGNRLQCYNGAVTRTARASERCEVRLYVYNTVTYNNVIVSPQISLGSTALPYEPYGYKIPLTVNGTESPIYLGQVETTRKIKKLVLDGTENVEAIASSATGYTVMRFSVTGYLRDTNYTPISTHYLGQRAITGIDEFTKNNRFAFLASSSGSNYMYIYDNRYTTAADFKSYLAAQYAAGTPVNVWYVLSTPETSIINEPLMKIGDYADTVTATNIPATGTAEQFDIQTTLKPSEVSLTYHGWHEHTDTKYTQGE